MNATAYSGKRKLAITSAGGFSNDGTLILQLNLFADQWQSLGRAHSAGQVTCPGKFNVSSDLTAGTVKRERGLCEQHAAADGKADNFVQQGVSSHRGILNGSHAGSAGTTKQGNASFSLEFSTLARGILQSVCGEFLISMENPNLQIRRILPDVVMMRVCRVTGLLKGGVGGGF